MLSENSFRKILKKAGALRVSREAAKKLREVSEKYSFTTARKAVKNAEYSGRKSVKAEDVEEALKPEES